MLNLIYLVVFLGFFAGALVGPVLSPLFLHPEHGSILPASVSMATKAFLLGTAMAAGRFGEFIGSPILGQLSDRYGRKRVLALAMTVTASGNLVIGLAIVERNVWVLIAAQFMIGFAGILLILAQAEVAHHTKGADKTRRFGMIYMASSAAYVVAPVVGGHLADVTRHDWASHAIPFYVAAAISAATVLLIWWRFPGSIALAEAKWREADPPGPTVNDAQQDGAAPPAPAPASRRPLDLAGGFREFAAAFRLAPFRALLVVNFLLYLGIDFVFQFSPVYFVQTWQFTAAEIGWFMSYTSIAMVAAQLLLVAPAGRRGGPRAVTSACAAALGVLLVVLVAPDRWGWLYLILPCVAASMSLATTNMSALLSDTAPADAQGRMLGVSHSVRVLGSALLCFAGGILAGFSPKGPILLGAAASLAAAWLLVWPRLRHRA